MLGGVLFSFFWFMKWPALLVAVVCNQAFLQLGSLACFTFT
jgi:hypothetical protein